MTLCPSSRRSLGVEGFKLRFTEEVDGAVESIAAEG